MIHYRTTIRVNAARTRRHLARQSGAPRAFGALIAKGG